MKKITLDRDYRTDIVTIGKIYNSDDCFELHTIELPYKDNKVSISCIPAGTWIAKMDYYHKGGYHSYEVMDVPGRSEIKIHIANYTSDILGCIGLGMDRNVNVPAVWSSRQAYGKWMKYMNGVKEFKLEVNDK